MAATILLLGWVAAVAAVFVAATRPWRTPAARAPLPMILAVVAAGWCLWDGSVLYADLMTRGAWTAASIVIPYVPGKALLFALLAYVTGRGFLTARASGEKDTRRYLIPAGLAVLTVALIGNDVKASFAAAQVRAARSTVLNPTQIAVIANRIATGTASEEEIGAFLENPLCPQDLLLKYADDTPARKIRVARNPNITEDMIVKLSRDPDGNVRYYAAHSIHLPEVELPRLATDSNDMVREAVTWKKNLPDEDFARLAHDAASSVRATAVLQPRIPDADVLRLTSDSDVMVRNNATRIAIQRGLKE